MSERLSAAELRNLGEAVAPHTRVPPFASPRYPMIAALEFPGHTVCETVVPFAGPSTGLRHIERDRKAISYELYGGIDVVLLPTTTTTVPRITSAGHPQSLSPENGFDPNGLPVGLQIVGKPSGDPDVLTLGHQFEHTIGLFVQHPPQD